MERISAVVAVICVAAYCSLSARTGILENLYRINEESDKASLDRRYAEEGKSKPEKREQASEAHDG